MKFYVFDVHVFLGLLFIIQNKIVSLTRSDILVSGVDCSWLLLFMLHPRTKRGFAKCNLRSLTLSGILGYGVDLFQGFAILLFDIRGF